MSKKKLKKVYKIVDFLILILTVKGLRFGKFVQEIR